MSALTTTERDALRNAGLAMPEDWPPRTLGQIHAQDRLDALERVIAERYRVARSAYVALLHSYHEADPDHCGGECFKSELIDAALRDGAA